MPGHEHEPGHRHKGRAARQRRHVSLGAAHGCLEVPSDRDLREPPRAPYVDLAHRVALFYSFALLLVATFVQLSGFSETVNLIAAGAMAFYFYAATAGYAWYGHQQDTDNQFRDAPRRLHIFMYTLIFAEIGGWLILIAGFLDRQVF
jgi:hypothetical protein